MPNLQINLEEAANLYTYTFNQSVMLKEIIMTWKIYKEK
jgi:hypothetical protein